MHKVEKEILEKNPSYEMTVKMLDKAWNDAKNKNEKLELIQIYCDISGSKPSEIHEFIQDKSEYKNIEGREYKIFNPPTVSEQLEYFDKRRENAVKNIKNIILTRNSKYEIQKYFSDKININEAELKDLMKLKGVGDSKAKLILGVRDQVGGFKKLEEIRRIQGIGYKTFKFLEQFIEI